MSVLQPDKTIILKCSARELNEVVSGERKVITREIRPRNARMYVLLNDEKECIGVIPRDFVTLQCREHSASVTAKVERIMLMEIEDENGELVYYEQNGETYQMVDIDFYLGEITAKSGVFPILSNH